MEGTVRQWVRLGAPYADVSSDFELEDSDSNTLINVGAE